MPVVRLLLLLMLLLPCPLHAQTRIVNAPSLRYVADGAEREIAANVLTLDVERARLASRLTLRAAAGVVDAAAARCDDGRAVAAPVAADPSEAATTSRDSSSIRFACCPCEWIDDGLPTTPSADTYA